MSKAVRLDKFLADAGKGTRSEVKKYIQKGLVQINSQTVKKPEQKVTEEDRVELLGEPVSRAPEFVYYLLNKPAGYVSATEDRYDRTVMELITEPRKGMFPVGRLDKDTEGLLLITDDGALTHDLLSPARHVEKTYFVRVEGAVTEEDRQKLEQGIDIGEKRLTLPAKVQLFSRDGSDMENSELLRRVRTENLPESYTELLLTISEGKFHQVKRMMAAVGKPVIYLKRLSMGPLTLPDQLKKGEYRPLTAEEVQKLKNAGCSSTGK